MSVCAISAADRAAQPNFVVIMADDLGYGDISPYGGWIRTPHLEQLAAGGMTFSDFHSSGNVCSPTRAGLMTGRYQQRAGIPGVIFADATRGEIHHHGLQPQEVTFAEVLKEAGYATAIFGKWHLGYYPKYNPVRQGFDLFRGYVSGNVDFFSHVDQSGAFDWWQQDRLLQEEGYTTHLITKHAVKFLEDNRSRPFCLYLPHEAPHYPYQGPNDPPLRSVGGRFDLTGERKDIKAAYSEMVVEMDSSVGEIVATLNRLGLAGNTLLLFFSDNGANNRGSNGPLRGAKGSNWEGGHRVPCIASWPGRIKAGSKSDQLSISLDVMPTLLDTARLAAPKERPLDGQSLLPVLLEEKPLGRRQLVWNGKAIRDGQWKLIVDGKGSKGIGLYDLASDLGEMNNLASQHPERTERLLSALKTWQADVANGATGQPSEQ
ncbi:sulfatase-like hydrolase/transferase [bacterium]|nr:sulfatase-like hydrolase/transferase [bacterium]